MGMLEDGVNAIGRGASAVVNGLGRMVVAAARFSRDTARFSYHLLGQYTFPLEDQLPPRPHWIGLTVLTFPIPLTLISSLLSITLVPLFGNSIQNIVSGFGRVWNSAWFDDPSIHMVPAKEDRSWLRRNVYGLPGSLIGGLAGILVSSVVVVLRMVANSFETGFYAFMEMVNISLDEEVRFMHVEFEDKERDFNNDEENQKRYQQDKEAFTRAYWFQTYVLGGPGWLIGRILGFVIGTVGLGFLYDTWISANYAFMAVLNAIYPEEDIPAFGTDKRSWYRRLMGALGSVLGFVFAVFGVMLFETVVQSAINLAQAFVGVFNFFWFDQPKQHKLALDIRARAWPRLILGVVGSVLGVVLGGVVSAVVLLIRGIGNTLLTAGYVFMGLVNRAVSDTPRWGLAQKEKDFRPFELFEYAWMVLLPVLPMVVISRILGLRDDREETFTGQVNRRDFWRWNDSEKKSAFRFRTYVLGFLGFVIGGIPGVIAAVFVGIARNTWQGFKRGFLTAMQYAWLDNPKEKRPGNSVLTSSDPRTLLRQRLGYPSWVLGWIIGVPMAVGAFVLRIVGNTFETGAYIFMTIVNMALNKEIPEWKFSDKLKRSNRFETYVLGMMGFVGGGIFGVIAAGVITTARHSWENLKRAFVPVFNFFWVAQPADHKLSLEKDERHWTRQVLGVIGSLLGGVLGSVLAVLVSFFRHTLINLTRAFLSTFTLGWFDKPERHIVLEEDKRYGFFKGVGFLGTLIGSVSGVLYSSVVGFLRIVNASWNSWKALSGSFINGGWGVRIFEGLRGDLRSLPKKLWGMPGYLVAIGTAGVLGAVIFVVRQSLHFAAMVMAIAVSWLVGLIKWGWETPRFAKHDGFSQEQQAYQNLYASLDASGRFVPERTIMQHGDASGEDSAARFIYKCFTFNASSLHEKTLDAVRMAHAAYQGKDFFEDTAFTKAYQSVQEEYRRSFFDSQEEVDYHCMEVQHVAEFIKQYMQSQIPSSVSTMTKVTSFMTSLIHSAPAVTPSASEGPKWEDVPRISWMETFWGRRSQIPARGEEAPAPSSYPSSSGKR